MSNLIFPPHLQKGDRVIIVSPSGKIDKSFLKKAKMRLESWGLKVTQSPHASGSRGFYSGTTDNRLKDLQDVMNDEKTKAIFCSRGGYGAVHLIDKLNFNKFSKHPKWLIGFSDITALHNTFQAQGYVSLHAPMARHLSVEPEDDYCVETMKQILFGTALQEEEEPLIYTYRTHRLNQLGTAEGILRGGNLAVLYGLRGTPYDIPPKGTILFIEDVGERPHAIERMIYNLKLGGVLENLSGLIIGQFTEYEENKSLGKELYDALWDIVRQYNYPICFNFPVGHVSMNVPLISGAEVRLEVEKSKTKLIFKPKNY